jgi:hypothetical protein
MREILFAITTDIGDKRHSLITVAWFPENLLDTSVYLGRRI